jgi:hypothetical protein
MSDGRTEGRTDGRTDGDYFYIPRRLSARDNKESDICFINNTKLNRNINFKVTVLKSTEVLTPEKHKIGIVYIKHLEHLQQIDMQRKIRNKLRNELKIVIVIFSHFFLFFSLKELNERMIKTKSN